MPIVGDSLFSPNDSIPAIRNTFEETVNYIVSECEAAGQDLPWVQSAEEYGRISKGACVGLKSRVLLYAASPLYNGGQIATSDPLKKVTGYSNSSLERWKLAL